MHRLPGMLGPLWLSPPGMPVTREPFPSSPCLQQEYHNAPHGAHGAGEFPRTPLSGTRPDHPVLPFQVVEEVSLEGAPTSSTPQRVAWPPPLCRRTRSHYLSSPSAFLRCSILPVVKRLSPLGPSPCPRHCRPSTIPFLGQVCQPLSPVSRNDASNTGSSRQHRAQDWSVYRCVVRRSRTFVRRLQTPTSATRRRLLRGPRPVVLGRLLLEQSFTLLKGALQKRA